MILSEPHIFDSQGEAVESISIDLIVSPHHTEVHFSDLKGYAKHVILELINEKNHKLSDKELHSTENCRGTNIKVLTELFGFKLADQQLTI